MNVKKKKSRLSIGVKLYIFIIITVLSVTLWTALMSYFINADKIDTYYKDAAFDNAGHFASLVDGDYLGRLRQVLVTEEYQALREKAEERDDQDLITAYLQEKGLWEEYLETWNSLNRYLQSMSTLKYLYLLSLEGPDSLYDMCIMDDEENPLYISGCYIQRADQFMGMDLSGYVEPTISSGDWGWLCSAYAPVYDKSGHVIAHVGCDIDMSEVMEERHKDLAGSILAAVSFTVLVLMIAVHLINRLVIYPIKILTEEMTHFKPSVNASIEQAGVVHLAMKSNDEIAQLYEGIRSMQVNIVDYLSDLDALQRDKEKAEEDIKNRDAQIGQISQEVYRDALTGVGSKAAYLQKSAELNQALDHGSENFALVMVDMNDLKKINDEYGHKAGDQYIRGCCHLACDAFSHSPVYRVGGDEFIIVLQGSDYDNRIDLLENLKLKYNEYENAPEPWERYSAALGMAEPSADDLTIDLVFRRADQAMYEDKKRHKEIFGSYR